MQLLQAEKYLLLCRTHIDAATPPPAPLHPIRSQANGVRPTKSPTNALRNVASTKEIEIIAGRLHSINRTHSGEGLPQRSRRSLLSAVCSVR